MTLLKPNHRLLCLARWVLFLLLYNQKRIVNLQGYFPKRKMSTYIRLFPKEEEESMSLSPKEEDEYTRMLPDEEEEHKVRLFPEEESEPTERSPQEEDVSLGFPSKAEALSRRFCQKEESTLKRLLRNEEGKSMGFMPNEECVSRRAYHKEASTSARFRLKEKGAFSRFQFKEEGAARRCQFREENTPMRVGSEEEGVSYRVRPKEKLLTCLYKEDEPNKVTLGKGLRVDVEKTSLKSRSGRQMSCHLKSDAVRGANGRSKTAALHSSIKVRILIMHQYSTYIFISAFMCFSIIVFSCKVFTKSVCATD